MQETGGQEAKGRGASIASFVLLAADAFLTLVILAVPLFVGPAVLDMYTELEAPLPLVPRLVLCLPPAFYVVAGAGIIGGLIAKEVLVRQKRVTAIINAIVVIVLLVAISVLGVVLFWTLWGINAALS